MGNVDGSRLGRSIRALRRRRGWRQSDLAASARMSQSAVSRIELGQIDGLSLRALARVAEVLGARLIVDVRWEGERLDRLLDADHARLIETVLRRLRAWQWVTAPEVSFSFFGERGSIDVLALHPATRSCLVVEAKSVVPDLQATLATLDRKRRLGSRIAKDRGWDARSVSSLLVVAESRTARRRVESHAETFDAAFPLRGVPLRRWLRAPDGRAMSGLWFLSITRDAALSRDAGRTTRVRGAVPRSA